MAFYIFTSLGIILLLYIAISLAWSLGEWILYGQTYPSLVDDLIAFALAVSFFYNIY